MGTGILLTAALLSAAASDAPQAPGPDPNAPPAPPSINAQVEMTKGAVVERIACLSDPTQTYALYLPTAWAPDHPLPVLVLMDPRGRALVPVDLFRRAAEARGWILMSSYDTASDGPWEPNQKAVRALLPETQRYAADPHRVYLSGFSGTARVSWEFGLRLPGRVAGLIGFGGGLPFPSSKLRDVRLAFFGASGRLDFNHEEMRALDEQLEGMKVAHRFESFDGPHSWGPEPLCAEAVDWMELQAMKSGLRPRADVLIEEMVARRRENARALETGGDPYEAFLAWRALERDLTGLRDVTEEKTRRAALQASRAVKQAQAEVASLARRQSAFEVQLSAVLKSFHAPEGPPPLSRTLAYLQVPALKRRAADTKDRLEADAAARQLELAFVHASFYEPREFLDQSNPDRALAMLEVAKAIKPDDPRVTYGQARAHARAGRKEKAFDALKRVVEAGAVDAAFLEQDVDLASLRGETAWREIVERARATQPADK